MNRRSVQCRSLGEGRTIIHQKKSTIFICIYNKTYIGLALGRERQNFMAVIRTRERLKNEYGILAAAG